LAKQNTVDFTAVFDKPAGFEIVKRTHSVEIQREKFETAVC
jgi:hypothetical protein